MNPFPPPLTVTNSIPSFVNIVFVEVNTLLPEKNVFLFKHLDVYIKVMPPEFAHGNRFYQKDHGLGCYIHILIFARLLIPFKPTTRSFNSKSEFESELSA